MKYTRHARLRMGQRGIPDRMVELALRHGRIEGDRRVLDRREARLVLDSLDAERAALMKVIDKGGLAVVESADTIVTTYNLTERQREH
jgi:hypothetical protein